MQRMLSMRHVGNRPNTCLKKLHQRRTYHNINGCIFHEFLEPNDYKINCIASNQRLITYCHIHLRYNLLSDY